MSNYPLLQQRKARSARPPSCTAKAHDQESARFKTSRILVGLAGGEASVGNLANIGLAKDAEEETVVTRNDDLVACRGDAAVRTSKRTAAESCGGENENNPFFHANSPQS